MYNIYILINMSYMSYISKCPSKVEHKSPLSLVWNKSCISARSTSATKLGFHFNLYDHFAERSLKNRNT